MSLVGIIGGVIIVIVIKMLIKNMLIDGLVNAISGGESGNPIIRAVLNFVAPGLIALLFLFAASKITALCPQLAIFLVVITVVVGGILGLGFAYFATSIPFLGAFIAPAVAPIIPVFWMLLIIAIVEFILGIILPIVLPGAGLILSMVINLVITIITILVLGGFAGDVFNILNCAPTQNVGFLVDIQKKLFGTWINIGTPKF